MMVTHVCTTRTPTTHQDPASAGVIVSRLADRLSEFSPRALKIVVLPPVLQAARSAPSLWLHAVPLILKVWNGGLVVCGLVYSPGSMRCLTHTPIGHITAVGAAAARGDGLHATSWPGPGPTAAPAQSAGVSCLAL